MATSGPQYSSFDLSGAASLANLFMGKVGTSQNSGGTQTSGSKTTTESVDPAAVSATVKSILEGTQGLAAVASGQKKVGLYNSSTNQLMVNDLIARTAAEASKLNKTSTTSVNEAVADNKSTTTTSKPTLNTQPSQLAAGLIGSLSLIPAETRKAMLAKLGIGAEASNVNTLGNDTTVDPMGPLDSITRRGDVLGANVEQTVVPTSNAASATGVSSATAEPVSNIVSDAGVDGADEIVQSGVDLSGLDLDGAADIGMGVADSIASGVADGVGSAGDVAANVIEDTGSDLLGDVSDWFFAEGGLVRRKNYATGGIVNTGLRQQESPLTAIDSISPTSNVQTAVGDVTKAATGQSSGTGKTTAAPVTKKSGDDSGSASGTSTASDLGSNSGPFGTVAGLAPMAGMLASMVTGIPALGLAAKGMANAIGMGSMGSTATAPDIGSMSGMQGNESPSNDPASNSTDSPDAPGSEAPTGPDGSPSPDAPGSSSDSAPGDFGEGGSAPSGDAGPGDAYSKGGSISGAGDETSDSIPIHVSDGEYILNAEATKMFLPIIEHMNNMGKAKMAKTQAGVGQVRR